MSKWLQQQWYCVSGYHLFLVPLAWLFWLISGSRRFFYQAGLLRSYELPVPVVVVGNISVGGTGKTPLVVWLAKSLKKQGFNPGIISRGYGGSSIGTMEVHADGDSGIVGDEPILIARRSGCPVQIGRNRVKTAQALLKAHAECNIIISDDGLQHYSLQRDFEIAVINGSSFGNGWLLPAGPLREPTSRLKTVDAVVCSCGKPAPAALSMRLEGKVFHNLLDQKKTAQATDFLGKDICAVAGIGSPIRFFDSLSDLSLEFKSMAFPDHYPFQLSDLQNIKADVILMTEKDAVKCASFAKAHWWYLPVDAVVDEALLSSITQKIAN